MMKAIDLHTHSNASDGTYTPSELIDYAVEKNLGAIALTDHDTVDGINEALNRASYYSAQGIEIEVIPGIEFSTEYQGKDIHIVGLYIDKECEYFKRRIEKFALSRIKRNRQMCQKLREHGMDVTYEELETAFPQGTITRAHFARILMMKGYTKSIKEGFDRFIGDRCPCYVSRKKISPFRAVEIIRKSGGVPILAHPILYGMSKSRLEILVSRLKAAGLMGIEAVYSTYDASDERQIRQLASEYDLVISGGSDFHGKNKANIDLGTGLGHLFVSEDVLDGIKNAHNYVLNSSDSYRLQKILFTDLDGTLLREDKKISNYTFDVLKKWTEAGHYIALCSGRDINSVNSVYEELGLSSLNNVYTIAYNGGLIYDCHNRKTLHKNVLGVEDVAYVCQKAQEAGIYIQTYSDDNLIVMDVTEETLFYQRVIKTPVLISPGNLTDALTEGPCKCLLIELHDKNRLIAFKENMSEWAKERGISMMFSNEYYMEVIPSDAGKGKAVELLCQMLRIPGIVSVAAGDAQNDISMLDASDVAIAMLNADEEIKEASSMVTDFDNDNDGLAKALEDII